MRKLTAAISAFALVVSMTATSASAFTDGTADVEDPTPDGISDGQAQGVCNALAALHGPNTWTGTLEPGSIFGEVTSGPTPDGDRDIDEGSVVGTGTQVGETVQVYTEPFRNGGSVNMFGLAEVIAAHWTDSEYDFTAPYAWQSTYTFTCNMAELIPVGVHTWLGNPDTQAQENCEGDKNPHPQSDRGANCPWIQTGTESEARDDEEGSIGPVNEGGTLSGHENNGGPVPVDPNEVDLPDVQVVVCISPSSTGTKRPGAWQKKNGYEGTNCTTEWYNGGATIGVTNLNTGSNNVVTIPAT